MRTKQLLALAIDSSYLIINIRAIGASINPVSMSIHCHGRLKESRGRRMPLTTSP